MKYKILLAISIISALSACSDAPKGDEATISEAQKATEAKGEKFVVDTSASTIRFTGHGVGKNHPGKFRLSNGEVTMTNNQVSGGSFTINILSMELEQKGEMFDKKLRPHLMSGDFFDAAKFGTAKFEITKVEPYKASGVDTSVVDGANFLVSGNFTLKNEIKNITFPARIDLDGKILRAKGNFNIDRTQWKMNYGNDKSLGDQFISETVNIELDLQARGS